MKKFKITDLSLFFVIFIALGIICFLAFYIFNDKYVFYLKEDSIELSIGDNYTVGIIAKNPKYSSLKDYKFKVLDPDILSIDENGVIVAKKTGTTTIIVTSKNGFLNNEEFVVTVVKNEDIEISNVSFTDDVYSLKVGTKLDLSNNIIIEPIGADVFDLTWESSNNDIVSVDKNGDVFAKKIGEAIISVTFGDVSTKCSVIVQENSVLPETISLSNQNIELFVGDNKVISAIIFPENTTDKSIKWNSSDSSIVRVENGQIFGLSIGTSVITATTSNGKSASCNVMVKEVLVENISLEYSTLSLGVGDIHVVNATISPTNASNKTISWKSSNTGVVTVSNGKITAKKAGSATITATTSNGKSASVVVTVTENQVLASSISLDKVKVNLKVGESQIVNATINPTNASNKTVLWSSSNTSVATVLNGKITAKKAGSATITATTSNGKSASVAVTVTNSLINTTGVSIENGSEKVVYLNTIDGTTSLKLNAIVYPSNASNKNILWSSSNTNVATVDNNGNVVVKNLGTAKINVVTADGKHTDSFSITAKKKVIVVVTASLGVRMNDWFKTYTSANGNYYSIANKTLKYVYESGSGFEFQYGEGLDKAKAFLNDNYANYKNYVDISINFTMTGNSVKKLTCDGITTSDEYYEIADKYNSSVQSIKNLGYYNIQGFVFSHSPLNTKHPLASKNNIVYSHNKNACASGYRSAWKYYLSNKRMNSILSTGTYSNISFLDNFSSFVIIKSEEDRTFTWIRPFSTPEDDALHWDEATTKLYMQVAFDNAGM